VCCSVLQRVAACCSGLHCVALTGARMIIFRERNTPKHIASHTTAHCRIINNLQYTATCSSPLVQHNATHCNTLQHAATRVAVYCRLLMILQCAAVCDAMCLGVLRSRKIIIRAVCCRVLQCILQGVAASDATGCSMLLSQKTILSAVCTHTHASTFTHPNAHTRMHRHRRR